MANAARSDTGRSRTTISIFLIATAFAISCVRAPRVLSASHDTSRPTECDEHCLRKIVDGYLDALSKRDPSALVTTKSVRFTENGQELRLGQGLWQTASALGSYRVYVIDSDSSAAAVQTVLRDGQSIVQLLVRLRVRDRGISEVETLVAREGDTCCWAPNKLDSLSTAFAGSVATGDQLSRADLIGIADSYFEALQTAGTPEYRRPRLVRTMNRYENGKQTTNVTVNPNRINRWDAVTQLDSALFGRIRVANRRYPVVDARHGMLLGIVIFEYPTSRRPSEIISEFFKISGGRIQEIRAVIVTRAASGWR